MVKKLLASVFILGLIGTLIFNISNKTNADTDTNKSNIVDVTGDTNVEGATMVSPNATKGLEPGMKAPDFTLETLSGDKISLSDYKGKKVFLNFWATWCGPCRIEMPEMHEFQKDHEDELVILAVNATGTERKLEDVETFLDQGNFSFPVLLDKELDVTDRYKVITIPTTYFIGTNGMIQQERIMGPMNYEYMEKMLNKLD